MPKDNTRLVVNSDAAIIGFPCKVRLATMGSLLLSVSLLTAMACSLALADDHEFPKPNTISAKDGKVETDLYVVFGRADVSGATNAKGEEITEIWTRSYSTSKPDYSGNKIPDAEIPGPTLVYHPDNLLKVNFRNLLNTSANAALKQFEDHVRFNNHDDIEEFVPHEVNIPHNADNTNLHVHGLHVDPKKDNVTLLILPEDEDPSQYPPDLQSLVPDIDRWWEWIYNYKIPADHMPGTHWYHAHKHGATSTHVENGMAGAQVITPPEEERAIIPELWSKNGLNPHDRIMVMQEIANYGTQQGAAKGPIHGSSAADKTTLAWPDITVNGKHQPTLKLVRGQVERWRIVDAGANHRTASYVWVGGLRLPRRFPADMAKALQPITDFASAKQYIIAGGATPLDAKALQVIPIEFPGTVKLAALDGVTLNKSVDVSFDSPVLMGPGNRADLFVQAKSGARGTYYLCKNYDVAPPMSVFQTRYPEVFPKSDVAFWRYLVLTTGSVATGAAVTNPGSKFNNLSNDPYGIQAGYDQFKVNWPSKVNCAGNLVSGSNAKKTSLAPLLRGNVNGKHVEPTPIAGESYVFPGVGWQPTGGSALVDDEVLVTINLMPGEPSFEFDLETGLNPALNLASPTTTLNLQQRSNLEKFKLRKIDANGKLSHGVPAYASPITDDDIAGQQVIVFDKSGINFNYISPDNKANTQTIHQFSLNGRQFNVHDFVGNPHATMMIRDAVPANIPNPYVAGELLGTYNYLGAGSWSNQVQIGGNAVAYFTNPGYFVTVVKKEDYYTYDNAAANLTAPDYSTLTGLPQAEQPEAQTAEEWLLVNNSKIFHPFHIHISPFLVKEVGQVNYENKKWGIKRLKASDPLGYVLDNWWDVIIIPPQGYVRIQTWLNVPDQKPSQESIDKGLYPSDPGFEWTVTENANVFGAWVYHCHILRHEDRGMMMMVNVKPKPE